MGWAVGYDSKWERWIGYGVPAWCDYPGCREEIDRGLGYVCGGEPYGGERGCGLFFCPKHKGLELCERCIKHKKPFEPSPEHPSWVKHLLTDKSWKEWRKENPEQVKKYKSFSPVKPIGR